MSWRSLWFLAAQLIYPASATLLSYGSVAARVTVRPISPPTQPLHSPLPRFKKSGEFDRLRRHLLSQFQRSVRLSCTLSFSIHTHSFIGWDINVSVQGRGYRATAARVRR